MSALASIVPLEAGPDQRQIEPQTRGYLVGLVRRLTPEWLEHEAARAAAAGFNVLIFPAYSNGWTLFPSRAAREGGMPPIHPLLRRWDPLGVLAEQAAAHGLALWAMLRPYHFHRRYTMAEHRLLRRRPQWRLRPHPDFPGAAAADPDRPLQACPLNREYRRYVAAVMTELAEGYPIDGLVLDFTGFSLRGGPLERSPYCFCPSCRQLYRDDRAADAEEGDEAERVRTGGAIPPLQAAGLASRRATPADLIADAAGEGLERVRQWQRRRALGTLTYLRHRLIRARRQIRFLCRARPHWRETTLDGAPCPDPHDMLDWPALLADGTVEELLVDHDGELCASTFGARLAADYAWLGDRVAFQPVLAAEDPAHLEPAATVLARYPVPGLLVDLPRGLRSDDVERLRGGLFAQPAAPPESDPLMAAYGLLDRLCRSLERVRAAHDLLYDLLRVLTAYRPEPPPFAALEMIEENLWGLEQHARRGRLGAAAFSEADLRDLGLARRLVRMACMDVRS